MIKRYLLLLCLLAGMASCNNFGEKVKVEQSEVYYKDGAFVTEAKDLAAWFLTNGWFDKTSHKSAQLTKDGDVYTVRLVIDKEKLAENPTAITSLWVMQKLMGDGAFDGAVTHIILADTKMKDVKAIDPLATYMADKFTTIYYNSAVYKMEDARTLGQAFKTTGLLDAENEKSILLTQEAGNNAVRLVVDRDMVEAAMAEYLPQYRQMAYTIKTDAFAGKPTAFYLTSTEYEDFKQVPMPTAAEAAAAQQQPVQN